MVLAFTCLLVQNFLVYRIWRLSRKNVPLVCILEIIVVAEFAAVTVPSIEWIAKLINSLMVSADFAIAAALIYYLNHSRTGFKRSETMINRLIVFTIHTGLATSVFATLSLIFSSLYPTALIYVTFFICVSKLYVNALFATLNSRTSMRSAGEETQDSQSILLSAFRSSHSLRRGQQQEKQQQQQRSHSYSRTHCDPGVVAIKVDTETTHDSALDPKQVMKWLIVCPTRVLSSPLF
ncbi:hypothetical protein EW145_g7924 [Phellinidium pouzarii]|uniref:DUF6534 domain-containing protein n=1 Tax=Phellinidium pouzarii TaxID=167371 RepID=A0A4S4KGJ6_9AGAM|nr:hypothetical protein EW145_g7924 [Phellinidium pouzarii]